MLIIKYAYFSQKLSILTENDVGGVHDILIHGHLTDEHRGASARHVGWREALVLVVGNDP